jgi:hypothetical protein
MRARHQECLLMLLALLLLLLLLLLSTRGQVTACSSRSSRSSSSSSSSKGTAGKQGVQVRCCRNSNSKRTRQQAASSSSSSSAGSSTGSSRALSLRKYWGKRQQPLRQQPRQQDGLQQQGRDLVAHRLEPLVQQQMAERALFDGRLEKLVEAANMQHSNERAGLLQRLLQEHYACAPELRAAVKAGYEQQMQAVQRRAETEFGSRA